MSRDVVVLSAVRSAIGSFGGSLSSFEPAELGGIVMKEAVARSGVDPALINYVTVGNTIPTDSRYAYGTALHVSGRDAEKLRASVAPFMSGAQRWEKIESGLEDVFISLMETAKDNFS